MWTTKVTSFPIMASILQLIHDHSKIHKPLKKLYFFVHPKKLAPMSNNRTQVSGMSMFFLNEK
jgi:hypothetical protein